MTSTPPMSHALRAAVFANPGAREAYNTSPYARLWIEALDTHRQAVEDVMRDIGHGPAVAAMVGDRYVRKMLERIAADAAEAAVRDAQLRARIESAPVWRPSDVND